MSNILDLFTSQRQSDGGGDTTATLDGLSEDDNSDGSSLGTFFNELANTYKTVNGALGNHSAATNAPATVPAQAKPAAATNYTPWIIGGVALVVVFFVLARK